MNVLGFKRIADLGVIYDPRIYTVVRDRQGRGQITTWKIPEPVEN